MNPGIPKSARDALASQRPAEHPSPDLLNGYVEQSLSPAEKATVTLHLAACEDCREVVFLASAATEEPSPAAIAEPARVWRGWKWAIPAVAALALVSSILVEHRKASAPATATATQTTGNNASPVPSQIAAAPAAPKSEDTASGIAFNSTTSREELRATTTAGKKTSGHDQNAAGKVKQDRGTLALLSQPGPLTASPSPEGVTRNADVTSSAGAAPASPLQAVVDQQAQAKRAFGAVGHSNFQSTEKGIASFGGVIGGTLGKIAPPGHWRITADGHLERSPDANTWTRVLAEQPVVFRAVAVVLNDIWAGGNNGVLFHSLDGGNHFSQAELSTDGHPENSAVISIHFDDVWHGSVTTESGTTWTTVDRGQTWGKQ